MTRYEIALGKTPPKPDPSDIPSEVNVEFSESGEPRSRRRGRIIRVDTPESILSRADINRRRRILSEEMREDLHAMHGINISEEAEEMLAEDTNGIIPEPEQTQEEIEEDQQRRARWQREQAQASQTPTQHDNMLESLWAAPPDVSRAFE